MWKSQNVATAMFFPKDERDLRYAEFRIYLNGSEYVHQNWINCYTQLSGLG